MLVEDGVLIYDRVEFIDHVIGSAKHSCFSDILGAEYLNELLKRENTGDLEDAIAEKMFFMNLDELDNIALKHFGQKFMKVIESHEKRR